MSDDEIEPTPRQPLRVKVPPNERDTYLEPGKLADSPPAMYYNVNTPPPDEKAPPVPVGGATVPKPTPSRRKKKKEGDYASPYELHYTVEDKPPWYLCIILGFQHYLVMFGATVANPLVLAPALCIRDDENLAKAQLIGTIFVVSGIATLLQTTLGIRLPIVQGGTFTFVTPSFALLSLARWECPEGWMNTTETEQLSNISGTENATILVKNTEPLWYPRIRELQGAIMVASLFQLLIGFSGLMGWMLRFIGPLAIAPTISLAGLALFDVATDFAKKQWWITLVTVVLIAAFSQYTKNIQIPCCSFQKKKGFVKRPFPIFRLFPVIIAIAISWMICGILTATGVFPSDPEEWGYGASTNIRIDVLDQSPWFRFPYPGQWGVPTVSSAGVFGMLAGVLASMVESVGDYYACARMAQVPPPPMHAVNRGIGIEGIGCILAGAWGSGSGTTSYSENIGAIGITKVASRRVIQVGAIIMIIFGTFGKFGALFVTIPDPIIGGVFIVMFGMIAAVGISNLQFVDLNSPRNLFIIGFSFFFGLALPRYLMENPGAINTGSEIADQILLVLLRTSMFVGGLSGFVLDNTIPGSEKERGLMKWREHLHTKETKGVEETGDEEEGATAGLRRNPLALYEIPYLTHQLKRWSWTKYVPFLPTFEEKEKKKGRERRKRKEDEHSV